MYLPINDKQIDKKQKEVFELNKKIIGDFKKLSFLKRWLVEEDVKLEVLNNWKHFELWMSERINLKKEQEKNKKNEI